MTGEFDRIEHDAVLNIICPVGCLQFITMFEDRGLPGEVRLTGCRYAPRDGIVETVNRIAGIFGCSEVDGDIAGAAGRNVDCCRFADDIE